MSHAGKCLREALHTLHNPDARYLWSRHSDFKARHAKKLAELLPSSKIASLNLEANMLGDNGAVVIAGALPPTVTLLNLAQNKIGDAGAAAIANILPNSNIIQLNLGENEIGNSGLTALANALVHSRVAEIDLTGNRVSHNQILEKALLTSKHLVGIKWENASEPLKEHIERNKDVALSLVHKILIPNGSGIETLTKEECREISERSGAVLHELGVVEKLSPNTLAAIWHEVVMHAANHGIAIKDLSPPSTYSTSHVSRLEQRKQQDAERSR